MKSNTKTKIITLTIVTLLLLVLVSYGYFYVSSNQSDRNRLTGGCFNTSFTDGDSINITNAFPESFDEAKSEEPYEFTITNSCTLPVKYYIILNVKTGSFNPNFINYSINNTSENKLYNALENVDRFVVDSGYNKSFIIGSGLLRSGSKTNQVRLWIDESIDQTSLPENSSFTAQIKVVGEVASQIGTDKILNLVSGSNSSSTDVITKPAPEGATCTNTLAYDGTVDNNLRYVGANPCNYVTFNGETAGWRIVGIMNNVDDGTGNKETRIKLVRKDFLGSYSWDTSESSVNSGRGVNDWTQADLKNELNGDYLNTTLQANTNWYNGQNNAQTGVFDYTKRLNAAAQNLIGDAKWYLGGFADNNANLIPSTMYVNERGTTVYSGRPTEWTGKVALIYPSDLGYATSGGETTNRSACIGTLSTYYNTSGETWSNSSYSDCKSNNWITYQWALSPSSNDPSRAFYVRSYYVGSNGTTNGGDPVFPAVYLKSSVSISGGSGTPTDPYTLG